MGLRQLIALTILLLEPAWCELPSLLPADVPIPNGQVVQTICSSCCQAQEYCGPVLQDVTVPDPAKPSASVFIPHGTNMTCILRDQSVDGAVDGGLCVPDIFPTLSPIQGFCRGFDQVRRSTLRSCRPLHVSMLLYHVVRIKGDGNVQMLPASYKLAEVIYQHGLVSGQSCTPCCDGLHVCDSSSACRPTSTMKGLSKTSAPRGLCVPLSATNKDICGTSVVLDESISCESCDSPSSTAQNYATRQREIARSAAAAPA